MLNEEKVDREFKAQFAACITQDELQLDNLLILFKSHREYDVLGKAFLLVSQGELQKAKVEVRRAYMAAVDSDKAVLFALSEILRLLPSAKNGSLMFADLPSDLLHYRVNLFDHLNDLIPGKFTLGTLTALEVEANCLSSRGWMRIGQYGENRVADLLYGSEADQSLALDLLDQAHAANLDCYDRCYADLIQQRQTVKIKSCVSGLPQRLRTSKGTIQERSYRTR